MKKAKLVLLSVIFVFAFAGCGRSKLIEGTYIHNADDIFGEFVIVHEGNNVSVKINGQEYEAEMEDQNKILVDGQYTIMETYCDSEGNLDIKNCEKDSILVLDAKEWIEGDYEVNKDGSLELILDKQ